MELILLTPWDLSIAALLVLLLAGLSFHLRLGIEKRLAVAAARSALQLGLLGLVLKVIFAQSNPITIGLLTLFMLLVASYEVMNRQQRRYHGFWGMGVGVLSMFLSSFSVTLLALLTSVRLNFSQIM